MIALMEAAEGSWNISTHTSTHTCPHTSTHTPTLTHTHNYWHQKSKRKMVLLINLFIVFSEKVSMNTHTSIKVVNKSDQCGDVVVR